METSNRFLKIAGKAELPSDIEIGSNYHISLEGAVTSKTEADNQDGTLTVYYKFKPIKIDLLDPKGKTLKLKDTRSLSQLFRARVYAQWTKTNATVEFTQYYEALMEMMIQHCPEIVEMYGKSR